jgi:hypothetical protein
VRCAVCNTSCCYLCERVPHWVQSCCAWSVRTFCKSRYTLACRASASVCMHAALATLTHCDLLFRVCAQAGMPFALLRCCVDRYPTNTIYTWMFEQITRQLVKNAVRWCHSRLERIGCGVLCCPQLQLHSGPAVGPSWQRHIYRAPHWAAPRPCLGLCPYVAPAREQRRSTQRGRLAGPQHADNTTNATPKQCLVASHHNIHHNPMLTIDDRCV